MKEDERGALVFGFTRLSRETAQYRSTDIQEHPRRTHRQLRLATHDPLTSSAVGAGLAPTHRRR